MSVTVVVVVSCYSGAVVTDSDAFKYRQLSPLQHEQHATAFGAAGEERAAVWLEEKGLVIWERNLQWKRCELDIVAFDEHEQCLVFVEVKSRTTASFGMPTQAVNGKKRAAMYNVALQYLRTARWRGQYRFDVISVLPDKIEHFKNVTW